MQFDVPRRISTAVPDAARIAKVREIFVQSAGPVRSLPSNATMMLACVAAFAILAILFAAPVGIKGFSKLSASGTALEYSVIVLLALVLSGSVIEQMIPGSRRIMSPALSLILAILLLSITASLLFPGFETHDFVRQGMPCLRLGTLCAVPSAGLLGLLMRRGFVIDVVPAAVAGGALAGLLGVGVLALHCPILNAAHIIAWHVGVIVVTSLAGALLGWVTARYR